MDDKMLSQVWQETAAFVQVPLLETTGSTKWPKKVLILGHSISDEQAGFENQNV